MSDKKNISSSNSSRDTNQSNQVKNDFDYYEESSGDDGGSKLKEENGWLQCSIYVSTSSPKVFEDVHKSIEKFFNSIGLKPEKYGIIRKGSWYQEFKVNISKISRRLLSERLKEVEHSVKLHAIEMVEAKISKDTADGVAGIISSLRDTDNAIIRLGYVVIVKVTINGSSTISSFNLTKEQNEHIYHNPDIFREPQLLFNYLAKNKNPDNETYGNNDFLTIKDQR